MTEKNSVYKCSICGNIVEVVHNSSGTLVCCNKNMELLSENTVDASKEKHVPVIKKTKNKVFIKIGSIPHPMEPDHYIEFIELIADNNSYKKFLKPGDKPEALFNVSAETVTAREFCNLHGLWKTDFTKKIKPIPTPNEPNNN